MIRVRFMPVAITDSPAFLAMDAPTRLLAYDLHVGAVVSTTIGIYTAPRAALEALGGPQVDEAIGALSRRGWVAYDAVAGVVRLPAYLADYRPNRPAAFRTYLRYLLQVPTCALRDQHVLALHAAASGWGVKYVAEVEAIVDRMVALEGAPQQAELGLGPMPVRIV